MRTRVLGTNFSAIVILDSRNGIHQIVEHEYCPVHPKLHTMTMLEISRSDHLENTGSTGTGVDAASRPCLNFALKIFLCAVNLPVHNNIGAYLE